MLSDVWQHPMAHKLLDLTWLKQAYGLLKVFGRVLAYETRNPRSRQSFLA